MGFCGLEETKFTERFLINVFEKSSNNDIFQVS